MMLLFDENGDLKSKHVCLAFLRRNVDYELQFTNYFPSKKIEHNKKRTSLFVVKLSIVILSFSIPENVFSVYRIYKL